MEKDANVFPKEKLMDKVPLLKDGRDELGCSEFEVDSLPPEGDSGCLCPEREQNASTGGKKMKTDVRGKIQALQLRKHLNYLDKLHEEKDLFIQKVRGELRACRQRMDLIIKQQESVAAKVELERESNNTAAVGRLQAVSRRLCTELENERDQQSQLTTLLKESEKAMWHTEIQKGQFEDIRKGAQREAEAARKCLQVKAAEQLHNEKEAVGKMERNRLLRIRKTIHLQKEFGLRHQKLVEDAQKNHRVAVKFLKASLGRIREQEKMEELESREHMRRRMDAVLALKNNITANRETLRKFRAWGRAKAELAKQKAQAEKEAILAQGGDAFRQLFHHRRRQELEAQQRAFEEEQKLKKYEIVSRILKEEAEEENRRKKQPLPTKTLERVTLRDKTWSYLSEVSRGMTTGAMPSCIPRTEASSDSSPPACSMTATGLWKTGSTLLPDDPQLIKVISSESVQSELGTVNPEDETVAELEISGLWDDDCKQCQVPTEDMDQKPLGGTKMDKDILARTLQRLRSGLIHKQVASGREFKGRPFNSKPELIHFKDFDIGKVYKKKITLVNATYTINYCKLVGVEEHLRDFIHIDFDPPGPMSAGMSCEMLVTFKPMINKDMEGSVSFLAQTGAFSIPLKCSTKKCSLSLDKELIDFGSYVVGETTSRVITLSNIGGLGTRFKFLRASEPCDMGSHLILKTSNIFPSEERGLYEKPLPSFSEQLVEGNESSILEVLSQKESGKQYSKDDEDRQTGDGEVPGPTVLTVPVEEEKAEISLGEITEGEVAPFSSIKVPIIFTPITPGSVHTRFKVVFKNQQCPTLYFGATGVAIDVPVWVPKPNVDLKICMYDRLYQDSILVHTRSKVALRLKLEVCKELRDHIELLPETGYIQALSSYSVQLKFKPRHSLPEDAGKYFDKETRVLEAPMTIRVADQIKPLEFMVHAVVTTSDLEFRPSVVDFSFCTIYEAIRARVNLYNHSLLPQEFGFIGVPKFVDIQPNDGFGTILPLETLLLDVIFQPTKAKEYNFELICKSEINRCFKLTCRAVGVHPPLELSHYQIKFAATSLYDVSVTSLYVINSHLSMNSLTHSVPRIGSGDTFPVGPTSFEFLLPPDSPITISPLVGTVLPGKSRRDTTTQRKDIRRQSTSVQRLPPRDRVSQVSTSYPLDLQMQELKCSSEEFLATQAILIRSFQGKFHKFVVPCVVASGDIKDRKGKESLSFRWGALPGTVCQTIIVLLNHNPVGGGGGLWSLEQVAAPALCMPCSAPSPHNTLYLELWCPSVAPSIIVTSNKGKTFSNFGDIAVGHHGLQKITIQNISSEDLTLQFSLLNPDGPFLLLNPIHKLPAGESHVLALTFSPQDSMQAHETLDIITRRGTLTLTLVGTGVASMITCSIEGDILNMGYVIARESVSSSFRLQNNSSLPIKFSMQLDSLAGARAETQQQLPRFLTSPAQRTEVVGTQNLSGLSVFSVVPVEGVLEPGKAQDFTVTFSPDHESLYFSDRLKVVLFEKKISHRILLKGAAREHMMFVEGGDPLDVPVESLAVITALDTERREEAEELKPILVTLDYVQFDGDMPAPPATRELQVGCIRTTQSSPKKTVEFSLDSLSVLQHKGFSIEPARGSVERGQTRAISISWVPPADFDPDHPLIASALLQLRGDVKETYKVLFVAQVVTSY
ncbi:cilia- and flagella-associated protein 74 isoform X2 [Erinaceus europaeus]|uniref:Cilia- and flagella-associated protein 74 isoform X2 n=1 Tax=Erinaceus europaeus TaxID=9365 RepID=A0ABM3Y472_ERIEU|nr:cilia- and flagella-associated protein 74 isoform X2 [Erinaceus europaeus]